jgi:hypothetical protein
LRRKGKPLVSVEAGKHPPKAQKRFVEGSNRAHGCSQYQKENAAIARTSKRENKQKIAIYIQKPYSNKGNSHLKNQKDQRHSANKKATLFICHSSLTIPTTPG